MCQLIDGVNTNPVTLSWKANAAIGLSAGSVSLGHNASGFNTANLPSFTPTGSCAGETVTTIEWSLSNGCYNNKVDITQDITVTQCTDCAGDATVSSDEETICSDGSFSPITLGVVSGTGTPDRFQITLFKGTDVLASYSSITANSGAATWTPQKKASVYGTGVYTITPYRNTTPGAADTVTLTVRPALTAPSFAPATYCHDITVAAQTYTPAAGTSVSWAVTAGSVNNLATGAGPGVHPQWTTNNPGTSDQTGTVTYTLKYTDGLPSSSGGCSVTSTQGITVRPQLVEPTHAAATYCHNERVDALPTTYTVPSGATLTWIASGNVDGLGTSGNGAPASFTSANTTTGNQSSTITYTLKYYNNIPAPDGCQSTFTQVITVQPLSACVTAEAVAPASQTICADANFSAITFTSTPATIAPSAIEYVVEYVSGGTNVVSNAPATITPGTATWTPAKSGATGTGTYKITPYNGGVASGVQGTDATFTLTVLPQLTGTLDNITACHNATVTPITGFTIPAGAALSWTVAGDNVGMSSGSGTDAYSFTTVNTSAVDKNTTVTYTLKYDSEPACAHTFTQIITVRPQLTGALTAKTYCPGDIATPAAEFALPTGTEISWTAANYANVGLTTALGSGKPSFAASYTAPGTATITYTLKYTTSPPCETTFTQDITVRPTLTGTLAAATYCHNATVEPASALNIQPGTNLSWTANGNVDGLSGGSGSGKPVFITNNTGGTNQTATITYTLQYDNEPNCPATFTQSVTVRPQLTGALPDVTYCHGEQATPAADFNVETGTELSWTAAGYNNIGLTDSGTGKPLFTTSNTTTAYQSGTITYTLKYTTSPECSATFTQVVTVRPQPTIANSAATYCHDENVSAVNLLALLPAALQADMKVEWAATGSNIGLTPASGINVIPSFITDNTSQAALTATITGTISYKDAPECAAATFTQTITVRPQIATLNDVVALDAKLRDTIFCHDETVATVSLASLDASLAITWANNNTSIGLGASGSTSVPQWTAANLSQADKTGILTYTVKYTAAPECTHTFTQNVTVHPRISTLDDVVALDAKLRDTIFCHGETVAPINLMPLPDNISVSWVKTDGGNIGTIPFSGGAQVPAWVTENTSNGAKTITLTYTVKYDANPECTYTFEQNITVRPQIAVLDAVIALDAALADTIFCHGETVAAIDLHAITSLSADFEVTWVNPNTSTGLTAAGTNTVPGYIAYNKGAMNNTSSITYTVSYSTAPACRFDFTQNITVLPALDSLLKMADVTYRNGDFVQNIHLNSLVPDNVTVDWTNSNTDIGLDAAGSGFIPSYIAINTGHVDVKAVITYTLRYASYPNTVCQALDSNTITVTPYTIGDLDLAVTPVESQTICYDDDFDDITLNAVHAHGLIPAGDTVTYIVEFVDGVNILDLSVPLNADTSIYPNPVQWTPTVISGAAGKGIYRITPRWDNNEGLSVIFTLEKRPELVASDIHTDTLTVSNGDHVPAYTFTGTNIPAGASIVWALKSGDNVGAVASGVNIIPAFTAVNTTPDTTEAKYYVWLDLNGCTSDSAEFIIRVAPRTISDIDLSVLPVASDTICEGSAFSAMTFTAKHAQGLIKDGDKITYKVEFVSGDNVLDLTNNVASATVTGGVTSATWTPATSGITGIGTYRVTPRWNNNEGLATLFTLEVLPALSGMLGIADATYRNGDFVPDVDLQALVPAGIAVSWTNSGDAIGLPAAGTGRVPSFVALNPTTADYKAELIYTVSYTGGACAAADTSIITVTPRTNLDLDLYMKPVTALTICNTDDTTGFGEVKLQALRTVGVPPQFTAGDSVAYIIEFVDGVDILDWTTTAGNTKSIKLTSLDASVFWTPSIGKDADGNLLTGKGTYRVTPRWNNNQGIAVRFTLEHLPGVNASDINVQSREYANGDQVPEYTFTGANIPECASIVWAWVAGDRVGSDTAGVSRIPAFLATNTGSDTITAVYKAWLEIGICESADSVSFTISVAPRTVDNTDLSVTPVESQTVCYNGTFADIKLTANYRFNAGFNDSTAFRWDLIAGTDILGLGTTGLLADNDNISTWDLSSAAGVTGSATYRVVPIWHNYQGLSTVFTLTRLPEPIVDTVSDIVVCNNSELPAIHFTGTSGTKFKWTLVDNTDTPITSDLGIASSGEDAIYLPRLVNGSSVTITEYIKITPVVTVDTLVCEGAPTKFGITVLPTPSVVQQPNVLAGVGTQVSDITFTGTATKFRWVIGSATIFANPATPTIGNDVIPAFITENISVDLVTSPVTVTPIYSANGLTCEGETMTFYIMVTPAFLIKPLEDIRVCEDEKTAQIVVDGLPSNDRYSIDWTCSNPLVGLTAAGSSLRSVPGLNPATIDPAKLSELTTATVEVTPKLTYGTPFFGIPVSFTITVVPKVRLNPTYGESDAPWHLEYCEGTSTGNDLTVVATGYNLSYQWYKDGVIVPGADKATYTIGAIETQHIGRYHVVVTGECGSQKSSFYDVLIKPEVIFQRWNDLLVVDTKVNTNGGYKFSNIQWYKNGISLGEDLTYYYEAGGLDVNASYHIVAETQYGTFISCEFRPEIVAKEGIMVYPNPVKVSNKVTIEGAATARSIRLYTITGDYISSVTPEVDAKVRMPNIPGIYLIQITLNNAQTKTFTIIVVQ
ncbi:MAG: T9SS type A sorting domain-containing protein [Prevotellaceae bacterium]|nr:T9SS type A sorting domain-containing protein [Prevotellaceae bacterium]